MTRTSLISQPLLVVFPLGWSGTNTFWPSGSGNVKKSGPVGKSNSTSPVKVGEAPITGTAITMENASASVTSAGISILILFFIFLLLIVSLCIVFLFLLPYALIDPEPGHTTGSA